MQRYDEQEITMSIYCKAADKIRSIYIINRGLGIVILPNLQNALFKQVVVGIHFVLKPAKR